MNNKKPKSSRKTELDSNWACAHSIFRSDAFVPNSKNTDHQSKPS